MNRNEDNQYADLDAVPDIHDRDWMTLGDNYRTIGGIVDIILLPFVGLGVVFLPTWLLPLIFIPTVLLVSAPEVAVILIRRWFAHLSLRLDGMGLTAGRLSRPLMRTTVLARAQNTEWRVPLFAAYTGLDKVPVWADRAWFRYRFGADVDNVGDVAIRQSHGFVVLTDRDVRPKEVISAAVAARKVVMRSNPDWQCGGIGTIRRLYRKLTKQTPCTGAAAFISPLDYPVDTRAKSKVARRINMLSTRVDALIDHLDDVLPATSAVSSTIRDDLLALSKTLAVERVLLDRAGAGTLESINNTLTRHESIIDGLSRSVNVLAASDDNTSALRRDIDDMNAVAALKTGERQSSVKSH